MMLVVGRLLMVQVAWEPFEGGSRYRCLYLAAMLECGPVQHQRPHSRVAVSLRQADVLMISTKSGAGRSGAQRARGNSRYFGRSFCLQMASSTLARKYGLESLCLQL